MSASEEPVLEDETVEQTVKMEDLLNEINLLKADLARERESFDVKLGEMQQKLEAKNKECEALKKTLQSKSDGPAPELSANQVNQIEHIKKISEEMLTKAKGVIFDKTKICQNQALQIEALTAQVGSLKDVAKITRDLLDIRNTEVDQLQEKMNYMEARFGHEKERFNLLNRKLEAMSKMNGDLKDEHKIQVKLFDTLRDAYAERDRIQSEQRNDVSESQENGTK